MFVLAADKAASRPTCSPTMSHFQLHPTTPRHTHNLVPEQHPPPRVKPIQRVSRVPCCCCPGVLLTVGVFAIGFRVTRRVTGPIKLLSTTHPSALLRSLHILPDGETDLVGLLQMCVFAKCVALPSSFALCCPPT